MSTNGRYDVIIIGTGAGGGTLAWRLAQTGKKILLLERGGFVPREKENWDSHAVLGDSRYKAHEFWRDSNGGEFHPGTHYFVGGNTKFYGTVLFRMRREDFGEVRHVDGISPAWPIAYDEMEPYYTAAETLYHVHGTRGEDPTEPEASGPFPHPAVSHEPRIQELHDDFEKLGLHPFHVPLGIRLDEQDEVGSACVRCDSCDGFPCLVNAKSDADILCVRPALEKPSVSILTHALVKRLETSASGREVTGVVVERGDVEERYAADVVVVSCGAINSAALLLRSANDAHPDGLANRSGQLGRNYMCHNNSAILCISKKPNPTKFQKTLGVNDYYHASEDWEFPMGHIGMVGKSDKVMLSLGAPKFAPGMVLDQMARHSLDFWLTTEDLPRQDNRVSVDKDGTVRLSYTPNNTKAHERLLVKLKQHLNMIGCDEGYFAQMHLYLGKKIPLAGVAHQCGTARFGTDPTDSVLDVNCRAHEVDNLYVVDAGFFPSSSAVNPALTIMANALRVGDHLAERLA